MTAMPLPVAEAFGPTSSALDAWRWVAEDAAAALDVELGSTSEEPGVRPVGWRS